MCIPHNIYGYKQASQGAMADFMIYPAGSIVHKVNDGLDSRWSISVLQIFTDPERRRPVSRMLRGASRLLSPRRRTGADEGEQFAS